MKTTKIMICLLLFVSVFLNGTEIKADDCIYYSSICSYPCIWIIMDKIVNVNGQNAGVSPWICSGDEPDALYGENSCGTLWPTGLFGCPVQSGTYGKECDYDCDSPF